ncbi:hypothetical protein [Amycolatopsis nigrescens]|uniref:hypothetical protein n=1 Tax=Amycolatopsis nigrescens TaxID=381445 RepID=UPI000381A7CD|nr:hypothetical protein [Amycolatopsis nigrescens]
MLDFLDTYARASAQALLVVCRYLDSRPKGQDGAALREALQPSALVKPTELKASMLGPALAVGEALGFIESDRGRQPVWTLSRTLDRRVLGDSPGSTRAFYDSVLSVLGKQSLAAVSSGEKVSDIVLGFVWLAAQDPLEPVSTNWSKGPEDMIIKAGLRREINNDTAWRPFYRWAISLGLAVEISTGTKRSALVPDCSNALRRALPRLPRSLPAEQWFRQVYSALPVLGDSRLVELVPGLTAQSGGTVIGGSLALALHKLEREGLVELVFAEDAVDAVLIQLGERTKRVNRVQILERA